ncbi:prefoldin subunit 5 [Histomonas meleagridis]|uniref:prefoldin subunit 5 n=1 Tax=Histomonas meleagridis TaxID=135588 RepID=UPI00355A9C81|nr:prefoldin subunit 5 [Histomonas meleagridis]KAH0803344.1 prefoldin subunit 5 [Histomonas meleagridis]
MAAQQLPLSSLSVDQLMMLKSQLEGDLDKLTQQIKMTNESVRNSQNAKEALAAFNASQPGKEMLVPITESMYVHGTVLETKRPIIEIGAGYFAETSVDNATQFFSRRISRLNGQQEKLAAQFKEKQQQYQITVQIINQKLSSYRQTQKAPQ